MGLRSEIQNAVSEAFNTDLADAVETFEVLRKTGYDPLTQTPPSWEVAGSGRGVFSATALRGAIQRIPDAAFNSEDLELVCLQNEVTVEPQVRDRVRYDGKEYIVEGVYPDPAGATYVLWLKKAGVDA